MPVSTKLVFVLDDLTGAYVCDLISDFDTTSSGSYLGNFTVPSNLSGNYVFKVKNALTKQVLGEGPFVISGGTPPPPPPPTCPPGDVQANPDGSCPQGYVADPNSPGCCMPVSPPPAGIKRVIVVMGENAGWTKSGGFVEKDGTKRSCPYLTQLANSFGTALNFHGKTSTSFPNYAEISGASDFGITTDVEPPQSAMEGQSSIRDLCVKAGVPFAIFEQSLPSDPWGGDQGGGTNYYIRHHNPWLYYCNFEDGTSWYLSSVKPLGALSDIPASGYVWLGPNGYYSGHTPNDVSNFDAWVKSFLSPLITEIQIGQVRDTIIIITIDNGYTNNLQTYCVVIGPNSQGKSSNQNYSHANIVSTVEKLLGLGNLGRDDASAQPMSDLTG